MNTRAAACPVFALIALAGLAAGAVRAGTAIQLAAGAGSQQRLAARELRRYVYLRTGELLEIRPDGSNGSDGEIILKTDRDLAAEQYRLKTEGPALIISGGSDLAVLYGAYAFAEKLGVRFYLHGDVVPDARIPFELPVLDETASPLFATRGILPFHDFPEGPDWWNLDDYKAYVDQLAKMRMNFIGLHAYPQGRIGPEPLVWIGLPQDVHPDGTVAASPPSQWAHTARATVVWDYAPMKTSEFSNGADQLFASDIYGPDVMEGCMPLDASPEKHNEVFNRVGRQMGAVFAHARRLGVKSCVGTETPMIIPHAVAARLKQLGRDPADPAVVKELYAGMFKRIGLAMPADYYWLWTPEAWTWSGNDAKAFEAVRRDIQAAGEALRESGTGMRLATSGWVLGPQNDRSALHAFLPPDAAMACINRVVGHEGVEPAFAAISGRSKWAIPWLENDPNMVGYQAWVGRMRYDAVDARRFGCDGLLGIHWRTKILSKSISALARAGWDASYIPAGTDTRVLGPDDLGPGGNIGAANTPIASADPPEVYRTLRWNIKGYKLSVPNGSYKVVLKFTEIAYDKPGVRVFGIRVQDKALADAFDIFATAGARFKAVDLTADNVRVEDGLLRIDFSSGSDFPCISGISIEGTADAANQIAAAPYARRINCGGGAVAGYEADQVSAVAAPAGRTMPVDDFYLDFATAQFGAAVAADAARILASLEGEIKVSDWGPGPGALHHPAPPAARAKVEQFAALRDKVSGPGNLARFDYWANTLRASIAMGDSVAARNALGGALNAAKQEKDPGKQSALVRDAISRRIELARTWDRLMNLQITVCDTPGELGTIANLEQQTRTRTAWLTAFDRDLAALAGKPLPPECDPGRAYAGPDRLTVLTVRGSAARGEALTLPILAVARQPVKSVHVLVRTLGGGEWQTIKALHAGRAVWNATLPPATGDIEYRIEAESADGARLAWPATAPVLNQTVVIAE